MLQGASVELVTITADRCMDIEGGVATDGWREGGSDTCAVAHMAVENLEGREKPWDSCRDRKSEVQYWQKLHLGANSFKVSLARG